MILTKKVKVRINNKNIEHYKNNNIDVVYGGIYELHVDLLPKYSKYKVLVKCESCDNSQELPLFKYNKNKERGGSYNCKSCNNITYKKSMMEKYGADNPSKVESCIEKRKNTCSDKYGSEYFISSEYSKIKINETNLRKYGGHPMKTKLKFKGVKKSNETKLKRGLIVPDNLLNDWQLYRKLVRKITERNREDLFNNWDGLDYYDNEYIKENFNFNHTDSNFPTLDHKISILYGFNNKIPAEEIADISNLCITKKGNNSSKTFLTEDDYINRKKPV